MSTPKVAKITNAGLAAANSASVGGIQVAITHIALGDGAAYTPTGTETALVNERLRVAISGYVRLNATAHKVFGDFIAANPAAEFAATEIGFFLADGTLFAVYSPGTGSIVYIDSEVNFIAAYTLNLSGVPTGSVTVTVDTTASATLALLANHENSANPHRSRISKIYKSADQVISLGTDTKVTLDTVEYDHIGGWDAVNGQFKPTIAGYYEFSAIIHWVVLHGDITVDGMLFIEIVKNGASSRSGSDAGIRGNTFTTESPTADFGADSSAFGWLYMNGSTDYVELYAMVTGGTGTVTLGSNPRNKMFLMLACKFLGSAPA
jgi:hypothetical protein